MQRRGLRSSSGLNARKFIVAARWSDKFAVVLVKIVISINYVHKVNFGLGTQKPSVGRYGMDKLT